MSEVLNIQENVTHYINEMIFRAHTLAAHLKRAEFGKQNMGMDLILGMDLIKEIIVVGYCTMHMSHMSANELEEILENTLAYFKTGLYDTDKISHIMIGGTRFPVRAWVYTPDTHNDAGERFLIYAFEKRKDAHKCITMLKQIEAELKRVG